MPMTCVSVGDAHRYCQWRGGQIPTTDQWLFAARGYQGQRYPWGDSAPANGFCRRTFAQGPCPVGSYAPDRSPFGVLDMAGNVAEYVIDHTPYSSTFVGGRYTESRVDWILTLDLNSSGTDERRSGDTGFRCVYPRP